MEDGKRKRKQEAVEKVVVVAGVKMVVKVVVVAGVKVMVTSMEQVEARVGKPKE